MPTIQAFRGLRYDLGHVGSLSDVITPPYDVISPQFQDELYKKHPANFIRLELNREEPGDNESSNKYARAAKFLKNWRQEGVLQVDPDPALYVYHQIYKTPQGVKIRKGLSALVQIDEPGKGKILPHEQTHSGPKIDRFNLISGDRNRVGCFGKLPGASSPALFGNGP